MTAARAGRADAAPQRRARTRHARARFSVIRENRFTETSQSWFYLANSHTHTMNLIPLLFRPASGLWRLLLVVSVLAVSGVEAWAKDEDASRTFDIPAGDAAQTLKQFAAQAGREIVFAPAAVAGVKTPAVNGRLTPNAALDLLLSDTGLIAREDEKTGAFSVRKAPEVPEKNAPGRRPEAAVRAEDGVTKLDSFAVNATKIDGLNNRGLLQGGDQAPLYHDVVSRMDIERLGVSSVEELFRYLPQTSSTTTALQTSVSNNRTSGGLINKTATVGLRGFSSAQTVVLINGRALPRSGLFGNDGADISRIPIAAIERIEILPYAGSAIYGAGALGGAINIILRKEFTGRDLTTYVGTSTEGGATEYRFTYLEGRSFNGGRTNLTLTVSHQHREALRGGDRDYLDEALRRYGPSSTATDAQGQRLFETLILPALSSSRATILVGSAPGDAVNDLGIPGAAGVRFAAIPAGTTPAGSLALTPDSFTATAGQAALGSRQSRSILYEPVDTYSLNAQVEHEFVKDRLSAYGEFTLGYNRRQFDMPQNLAFNLSATDPLNPFRTGVTPGFVGRPVRVFLDPTDIPDPSVLYEDGSARAVVGFKGKIAGEWEWSADGTIDYAHSTVSSDNPPDAMTTLVAFSPYADPGPSAPQATRRALYPLLADHGTSPISAADAERYFPSVRYSSNLSIQREGNARIMGPVVTLPAGPLRMSAVGKYQHWKFDFGQKFYGSDDWSQLVHAVPFDQNESSNNATRKIWQGALEFSVPVIGPTWRPLPIESLEFQGSFSRERDTTAGTDDNGDPFANKQASNSSVIATKLQLTRDIALRASYSEGFYPPEWSAVSLPTTQFTIPGFFADPKRGNTMQFTPSMSIMQGGNPGLKPETADSYNAGLILTPRFAPGLSLTADFWKIEKTDAIVFTSFVDVIANPDVFGFLITREAPTAADTALGWLGRITAVDARAFNASITRTEGVDLRLRYQLETASLGEFTFNSSASFTNNFRLLATPTAPEINTAGGSGPLGWRGNGSVTWSRDAWSATVTARYVGKRSTTTTAPSPSYPGAFPIDGEYLPAFVRWDLQTSYEIPASTAARGLQHWLQGTKWTLGVLNALNDKPTFVSDGSGFYNGADDPRQRFVYLQVKKSL